jgi:hypothetical protein
MALAELIQLATKRYVRYFGFGNDAWTIAIRDLPYLSDLIIPIRLPFATSNGYFATQTKYQQTDFMITDGKPSCVRKMVLII